MRCFKVGVFEGGCKKNKVASEATLRVLDQEKMIQWRKKQLLRVKQHCMETRIFKNRKNIQSTLWEVSHRQTSSPYPDSNLHTYVTCKSLKLFVGERARTPKGERFGVAIMTHMKKSACSRDFFPVRCLITEDEKGCSERLYISLPQR